MDDLALTSLKLRRYDIVRLIGKGARGRVYLGTDRIIRRPVAIKIFSLSEMTDRNHPKEKVMREFFSEIQTAGALLHPNIVVIYDVGMKYDLLYIVMEYVYGKTLLDHQRSAGFSIKKSVEVAYEIAQALDYAHSHGVVHRDIKPENIVLSTSGVPKITDFGIARFHRHLKTDKRYLVGSTRFVAPEQVLQREQDHRVDIYQVGVVLFELLTRKSLFKSSDPSVTFARIAQEEAPPPSSINPEIPPDIDRIVTRCLEKAPSKRFARAKDLADALAGCLKRGIHAGVAPNMEMLKNLTKFELFSRLSEAEMRQVAAVGTFVTCPRGRFIIEENETDSNFFVLVEGSAKVVKRSRVLTNFLPGSCFGEVGAFARHTRHAAVVAETDCTLLQLNAVLFKELDPQLQVHILHTLVRHLSNLVISLDNEIMELTDGKGGRDAAAHVCPLCGFENDAPIDVCGRCGAIPSAFDGASQSNQ